MQQNIFWFNAHRGERFFKSEYFLTDTEIVLLNRKQLQFHGEVCMFDFIFVWDLMIFMCLKIHESFNLQSTNLECSKAMMIWTKTAKSPSTTVSQLDKRSNYGGNALKNAAFLHIVKTLLVKKIWKHLWYLQSKINSRQMAVAFGLNWMSWINMSRKGHCIW